MISAGDDEAIYVWDPNTRKPTFQMGGAHDGVFATWAQLKADWDAAGAINHIKWIEDKRLLITCGEDMAVSTSRYNCVTSLTGRCAD